MRRVRNTNPALLAIVGEGFVSRLSFGMVGFALPLYAHSLGLSLPAIGLLASLNLMVALALKPLMGRLVDRIGLKVGLAAAIVARSAVTVLLAVAALPWQLFGARALHGVSIAVRDPSVDALIAEHGGKKAIAQSFAWYQTAKSVGGSLSKAAAGVLITLTASNFSIVFLVAFVLSLAPVLVVLRYVQEPQRPPRAAPERTPAHAPAAKPPALRFAGAGLLIGASGHMLNTFFPILATEYAGLTAAQAGALYAIGGFAAFAGPVFGWLSDNVSRALVLQLRSAANVLSSVLYLVSPSLAGFAAGRGLDDLGKAAFRPAWGSMMAHVSSYDRRRRAQIMGTMSSGEDAGEMLGPLLAGFLWATGGVGLLLGGRIALALSAEAYTTVVGRALAREETGTTPPSELDARRRRRLVAVPPAVVAVAAGLWTIDALDSHRDTPEANSPATSSARDNPSPGALVVERREAALRHAPSRRHRATRRPAQPAREQLPTLTPAPDVASPLALRPAPPARTAPQSTNPARRRPAHTPLQPAPAPIPVSAPADNGHEDAPTPERDREHWTETPTDEQPTTHREPPHRDSDEEPDE